MGQNMTVCEYKPPKGEELNRNHFEFLYIIGKGGFGKVWKVIHKGTKSILALKEMQKMKVIDKRSEKAIKYERELLSLMSHPFLVNMHYSFQDGDYLYLVMDLLIGGDLRYHISRHRAFSEEQTKFFVVCIVLALEYIHSKNIIHRDIKPENLVLEEKGYVRLTDFGIAKLHSSHNANETSGTPGYMSPEVMSGKDHSFAVDYFALGVMVYEFMLGRRPYLGKSRKEIKEKMMAKQANIKENEVPQGWDKQAADFCNKLLMRKAENRLGAKGIKELKEHPWVKDYNWKAVNDKATTPPFIPAKRDNFDRRYCEAIDKNGYETQHRYEKIRNAPGFESKFINYTFYKIRTGEEDKAFPLSSSYYKQDSKPKQNITAYAFNSTHNKFKSNIQSSKSMRQMQEVSYNNSKPSGLSVTKRDNSKSANSIQRSASTQLNLVKKNSTLMPKSPLSKDREADTSTRIKQSFATKMSLSPMSGYKSPSKALINSSLSFSNLLKPELTTNKRLQAFKEAQQELSLNLIKQIQHQKQLATKQIKRSNSSIINSIPINPVKCYEKQNLIASVNSYCNHRPLGSKSPLCLNQSSTRKTSQILIDNSFENQHHKHPNNSSNSIHSITSSKKIPTPHSDSINLLFKHYKISSVSSNSTGSSMGNNNRAHLMPNNK